MAGHGILTQRAWLWLSTIGLLIGVTGVLALVVTRHSRTEQHGVSRSLDASTTAAESPDQHTVTFLNTDLSVKYVGTEECAKCHGEIVESFRKTPHFRSTRLLDQSEIPETDDHGIVVTNPLTHWEYRATWSSPSTLEVDVTRAGALKVQPYATAQYILGSGWHGFTLLGIPKTEDSSGSPLRQLVLSYFSDKEAWGFSPGFEQIPDPNYLRDVTETCLFCHATYWPIQKPDVFGPRVLGISCEKCHGPGQTHVAKWNAALPDAPRTGTDLTITNPAHMSAARSSQICGECHTPSKTYIASEFYLYRPGQDFKDFYTFPDPQKGSIHSEYPSLVSSRCFQSSGNKLNCSTCHPPHSAPPDRDAFYVARCLSCHQEDAACGFLARSASVSEQRTCVACHMPSRSVFGGHFTVRNHAIGIYPLPAN